MKILIVDDDKNTCTLLMHMLKYIGHKNVSAVNSASEALELIEHDKEISIVIADWMMPEINGLEMCRRIRARTEGRYIYIIMLSSKKEKEDILKGFAAGIDAYLPKPPEHDTLDSRIQAGSRIVNLEQQLLAEKRTVSRYAKEMETLANERARQLVHAERMATLGTLSAGVAHEINNPTTFINGNALLLEKYWEIQKKYLDKLDLTEEETEQLNVLRSEIPEVIASIQNGVNRISTIVNGLKYYSHTGEEQPSIIYDIHQTIEDALLLCNTALKYNIEVEKDFADDLPALVGNPQQIEQVFVNIINNAADAMENMEQGYIYITTRHENNEIKISIADTGPGLTTESLKKVWDPFFTSKPAGKGTGLGMSISLGIIENHKGTIMAGTAPDGGARFSITLPT